jgi:hypothetical protein
MVVSVSDKSAATDPAFWADLKRIQLQKGYWSFKRREYLLEPMQEFARRWCFMKGTQGGFTELQVVKSLWGMIHGIYSRGVLYLFPTTDDVREFSKARFGPLIDSNPSTIGAYVRNTDTASLKRVSDSFLYLRGATLSYHLEHDAREAAKLRGISVDKCVFDEMDLMASDVMAKAKGRMGDSDVKEEVYISNPTLPDFGIASVFAQSDKRHWFRLCGCKTTNTRVGGSSTGSFTCAELEFPDCVKYRQDGTGYIACSNCGKPVLPEPGEWIPQDRERTAYMRGYRWSQLSSFQNDPGEILSEFTDPPDGNLADVVRLRLGLPYIAAEDRLTVAEVLGCCGSYPMLNSHPGPCAMGVDVGKTKHVVIGVRAGRERYKILRVLRLQEWSDLHDIARRFNVRSAVIDIRPYEDKAREFQRQERYRIYLCQYMESTPLGSSYNDKSGIVKVNRTEVMDGTHRLVTGGGNLELPRVCPEVKEFAKQLCATAKVLETNKRTHQQVYRYRKLDNDDHYRHALNYFYLAAQGGRIPVAGEKGRIHRQTHAINSYSRV